MPRRNVWYPAGIDAPFTAFCRSRGIGRGEGTRKLLDMAQGNHVTLRRDVAKHLAGIHADVAALRGRITTAQNVRALNLIAARANDIAAILARPAPGAD